MSDSDHSLFGRRPAVVALVFLIAGILASSLLHIPYYYPLIIFAATFLCASYMYLKQATQAASIFLMLFLSFLGWHLAAVSQGPFPPNHVANIVGDGFRTEIAGRVMEEPDFRPDKTYLILEADSLRIERDWIPTLGRIRVRISTGGLNVNHDDYLKIACFLYKPSGATNPLGFDYSAYLKTKEIFAEAYVSNPLNVIIIIRESSFLNSVVTPFRQKLTSIARQYLPPEKSSMLTGFILGERREMPEEYQKLFRDTGTMHLMAVSGSNVGMVLLIFGGLLSILHLARSAKAIVLLFVVGAFAVLTRLEPSVLRASIMAAVGIVAYGWMRKPDLINLLAFAGLLMLLWRPFQLFDVGFQLSFAATFGIIYALPRFSGVIKAFDRPNLRWLKWVVLALLGTLAAQIAVLPLVAHYFHSIPVLGALANIPVMLLAGLAITLGMALFALSIFGVWLPLLAAVPLQAVLDIIIAVLRFFASLPHARIASAAPGWSAIILFWLISYIVFEVINRRRLSKLALVSALVLLNIFIWGKGFEKHPDWRLEFLDLRRNHAWIFSAEERPMVACLDFFEPGSDAEDIIIPHILSSYDRKPNFILTVTPNSREIDRIASESDAEVISFAAGEAAKSYSESSIISNVSLAGIKVLWDQSDNTYAGVLAYPAIEISVDGGVLILAGWAGMTIREEKIETDIKLIELPWSRYAQSRTLEIVEECDPQFAIFSPDRYSVTAPERREKLTHSREKTLSTSLCGAFAISGYGGAIELETMKPRK